MSSWRNVLKQKIHYERSQPSNRKKLGLLEKHKDYKQRALNYHHKEEQLQNLRRKAALKNPDEFYYKMITYNRNEDHTPEGKAAYRKVAKALDSKFLVSKKTSEENQIDRMVDSLHFISNDSGQKHTLFVDSVDDIEQFTPASYFNTTEEMANQTFNRLTIDDMKNKKVLGVTDPETLTKMKKARESVYRSIERKMEKKDKIDNVLDHVTFQRNMLTSGRRKKVSDGKDGKPDVYKWNYKRKR